jgi:hypothetical protein
MMRRTIVLMSVALAMVLVFIGPLTGPGAGAASSPTQVVTDITFTEGFCGDPGSRCKVIGKNPIAYGARLIFKIPLTVEGTKIGYEEGECVNLPKKSQSYFCTYNLHLADGTVAVQGTLPSTFDRSGTIPVTGGTGAYLGAYGTLTYLDDGSSDYQLQVVTP